MKLKELYEMIDGYAPFALSKEYIARGAYDNSGLLIDCGGDIRGVLFSLDLSARAVTEAKRTGCNAIVTHHPAIWSALKRITFDETPDLALLISEKISVISAHLNLDAAEGGIDDCLMRGLGGNAPLAVMEELAGGGYGRVYERAPVSLEEFVQEAEKTFSTKRIICYGTNPVKRVASFCGGGFTESALSFALENGADTLVSSDGKHHLIAEAVERGLNVVLLTHYASEAYGFSKFFRRVQESVDVPCTLFVDENLL